MKLKLDNTKTYAIALAGGGAKGGYEIGVWKALDELGIKYNAVSGTSVGALNGALMTMRDYDRALEAWSDMRLDKVIELSDEQEENLKKVLSGQVERSDIRELIPQAFELIRNRGLDVAPLRAWVRQVVDAEKVKNSDVELFISTVSISDRKSLEIKVNDLEEDEICDILLASAYHPAFRLERLGGKLYADGGFVDSLPLRVLVENGYKDIIAVHIPGKGRIRRYKIPSDVNLTYVDTDSKLGSALNFSAEQAAFDMKVGYLDAYHDLCGLYGRMYYIDRTMSELEALEELIEIYRRVNGADTELRTLLERDIPERARREGLEGGYFTILEDMMEKSAAELNVDRLRIYTDREFIEAIEKAAM